MRGRAVALGWGLVLVSCAGAPPPAARAPHPMPRPAVAPAPDETPEPKPLRRVAVKGLTGTLNQDDVHQRMEAQQPAFDACIAQSRRSVRFVSGEIRFAFWVDAEGHVSQVRPIASSVGHRVLERCLTDAVAAVEFPKPAGRATARFAWGMTVEPVGKPPDTLEPERVAPLLRKRRPLIAHVCALKRRDRFRVTAYVATNGRVLSAGAFARRPRAADKVDCVLDAVSGLRMPKVAHRSKVTFDL